MKGFRENLRENGLDLDDTFPTATGPLGTLGHMDHDTDGMMKLARMAIENHYDDVMSFFGVLAGKDPVIQDELDRMSRDSLNKPFKPKKKPGSRLPGGQGDQGDEVVPHGADRADAGGDSDGGGQGGMG